ncbi:MAG: NepR family anti-sigma factor [Pseudomonadota bacterium]
MYSDMAENDPKSKIRRHIDENLRRIYNETLNEQIPDKLTQLLEQLRQKAGRPAGDNDEGGQS